MTDIQTLLQGLKRPTLLVQAARHGAPGYRRETHLRRLLGDTQLPGPAQASVQLFCLEQDHDAARVARSAEYSPARHIEVLAALMAEAQTLLASLDQEKASATSDFLRVV